MCIRDRVDIAESTYPSGPFKEVIDEAKAYWKDAREDVQTLSLIHILGMADGARYLIREYDLPLTEAEYYDVMRDVIAQLYDCLLYTSRCV